MHNTRSADCLVVGAGPAGLSAAYHLRRFQRVVVVFDHRHSHALAIEHTHNDTEFSQGISGHALLHQLCEQMTDLQGVAVIPLVWSAISGAPTAGAYRLLRQHSTPERNRAQPGATGRNRALGRWALNRCAHWPLEQDALWLSNLPVSTMLATAVVGTGTAYVALGSNATCRLAAGGGVPYGAWVAWVAWVGFATVVTAALWRRDR